MICITVTPTSRTLAKVDLLNAARHGDIIELCLDHLVKEPDIKDLLTAVDKPIIISCRRSQDGGQWKGTEDERLMLLRQAIVAGPAYIELDLDIAPKVPRFGKVERVISFTRMDRPEHDIDGIFDEAASAHADVVKFTWPTPTIDDAWPLLAAVSQKRRLPIVGMGLGPAELTFSLLGRKYGSPWIYAALEKGMEAHPGQATVFDLNDIYHCREVDRSTIFVAIAGFGEAAIITTRIFNAAFKQLDMNVRCLPIQIGDLNKLPKMLDKLKIRAILVFGTVGHDVLPLAQHIDKLDLQSQYIDLLLHKSDGWHGYNTIWRSAINALERALGRAESGQRPLDKLSVLVLGTGGVAQTMIYGISQRQGLVSVAGPNDKQAQQLASQMSCRHVPFQSVYDSLFDVIVIADESLKSGQKHGCINPGLFKHSNTVVDASHPPLEHELFVEARDRHCKLVEPGPIYVDQIRAQFKVIAGKELPDAAVAETFASR